MRSHLLTSSLVAALLAASISIVFFVAPVYSYSNYVALGDSVASGAGLGANLSTTCDRSSLAYPSLVARSLGTSVRNLACTGAKVDEGIYGPQERGGSTIAPQLRAAFSGGKPDLITMTIGANDMRWHSFIRDCYVFECGSLLDRGRAVVYRADLRFELRTALSRINQLSNGTPPTVLVNGYYNPIPQADCTATSEISDSEASWLAQQKGYLNSSLRRVVSEYSFARYVPVNFGGHKLCSSTPWIQFREDAAPFHPNAAGQQALARANLRALNN